MDIREMIRNVADASPIILVGGSFLAGMLALAVLLTVA